MFLHMSFFFCNFAHFFVFMNEFLEKEEAILKMLKTVFDP